jgi:hypothetical protein
MSNPLFSDLKDRVGDSSNGDGQNAGELQQD